MAEERKVQRHTRSQSTLEGAGGRLHRALGFDEAPIFDPFLLISGLPMAEPVAWLGPIIINSREELETAFREYREGTFIK